MKYAMKHLMQLGRLAGILAVAAWFLTAVPQAEAAKARLTRAPVKHGGTVTGTVVNAKGKPVRGAHVHLVNHHHKKKTSTANAVAKPAAAKLAAAHKSAHHGAMTTSKGTFALTASHKGSHMVVAHHKHEGSGHARVTLTNGVANVTIRLHKHHHAHA
jgi:hypothetical protein